MASNYPDAVDSLSTTRTDSTGMTGTHKDDHNNVADAINKIERELGTNPRGGYVTVNARLAAIAAAAGSVPPTPSNFSTALSDTIPVGWWRFGEAAGALQAAAVVGPTGTYNAVTFGAMSTLIGDSDTAVSFNGILGAGGSSVSFGNVFVFSGNLPFSASAFVNPTNLDSTSRRIFSKFDAGGVGWGVSATATTVTFYRSDQAGVADTVVSPSPLPLNTVSRVTATYDGTAMRLYINSQLVGTTTATRSAATTTAAFRIGNASTNDTLTWAGVIDEPAIHDRALSLTEDQNLYHAAGYTGAQNYSGAVLALGPVQYLRLGETSGTTAADSSPGLLNPGTYSGGYTLGVNGANTDGDKAVTFNGTSGYIDSTNPIDLGSFSKWTVSMWIYITAAPASDQYLFGNSEVGWVFYGLKINSLRQLVLGKISVADGNVSTLQVPTNAWTHIAVSYDSSQRVGAYTINGQAAGGTGVLSATALTVGAKLSRFGQTQGSQFFAGTMDEIAVFSEQLNTSDLNTQFLAGGGGTAPGGTAPPVGTLAWVADYETGNYSQWPDHQDAGTLGDPDSGGVGRGTTQVRGTDGAVTPAGGSFMNKIVLHASTGKMAAEMLHPRNFRQMIAGPPEFYGMGWYFPTSGNWGTNWEPGTGYQSGSTLCQLAFSGLFGGSVQLKIQDSSAFGETQPYVNCRIGGGYSPAYGTIDFQNSLAPGSPVNWTTHQNNQAAWDLGAVPQVAGPHTFLAGNHPLTLDAWNYFILEIKWATLINTGGYVQVWHKLKGGATWTKTYRCDITNAASDQNAQWGRGIGSDGRFGNGSDVIVNDKAGSYVNATASALTLYHDSFFRGDTFAVVAAQMP